MKIRAYEAMFTSDCAGIDWYAEFLHDGDFERFQPVCDHDKHSLQYLKDCVEIQREYVRALWIKQRLPVFLSPEWHILNQTILDEAKKYDYLRKALHQRLKSEIDQRGS